MPLMTCKMFAETIQLLNENRSGLGVVLRSNDPRLIKTFFEQERAESIQINAPLTDNYAGPCGGIKMSGNAREPGLEGLDSFLETRHAYWDWGFSPEVKN